MMEKTDMVQWCAKDAWWRKDCPLILGAWYRITEVARHDGIGDYYKIGGWYVMRDSLAVIPIKWVPIVGQAVRIALRVDEERGWRSVWSHGMTRYIGGTFTVKRVSPTGVYFEEDVQYGWPISCLEPII